MSTHYLSIAKSYSETPAGRYISDGPYSGQRFREEFLLPALKAYDKVTVDLDGALGFGSSFLEEAFGGLIRENNLDKNYINQKLTIKSSRELYLNRIKRYLADADKIKNK